MEAVRLTVELGRAARAQAKAKVRQPLRRAVIVANDAEREAIERPAPTSSPPSSTSRSSTSSPRRRELVSYTVKPNYRALGPRFGKQHAAGRRRGRGARRRPRRRGDRRGRRGRDQRSTATSTRSAPTTHPRLQPLEGYEVEAEAGHAVALQLELDDELRREGLAREIVHAVQNARKEAGLEITDRIALALGGDEELLAAAREHEPYIAGEVLATSVAYDGDGAGERRRSTAASSGSPSARPEWRRGR